jgi:hypothetical protein
VLFTKKMNELFGFHPIQIPKDGNCLFRACSLALFHTQDHHLLLREECSESKGPHIDDDDDVVDISQPGVWGGEAEMAILCSKHDVNILIFNEQRNQGNNQSNNAYNNHGKLTNCINLVTTMQRSARSICLSYHGASHYNYLGTLPQINFETIAIGSLIVSLIELMGYHRLHLVANCVFILIRQVTMHSNPNSNLLLLNLSADLHGQKSEDY